MHERSRKAIEAMYTTSPELTINEGDTFDVPVTGSLGLLATGYVGLIAWRKKRGVTGLHLHKLIGQSTEEPNSNAV